MKVRIHYSDGYYSASEYKPHSKLSWVEMPDDKWEQYQQHIQECRRWYHYLQTLDNEQCEKDVDKLKKEWR